MSLSEVGPNVLQGAAFLLVGLFFMASPLRALPVVYAVDGGSVDIEVRLGGTTIGSAPGVALLGDTVTIDAAALTLDAVRLEIAPVTISLSQSFGGYDEVTVESSILEGDLGFLTIASFGVPALFTAVAGPLTVTSSWGANDSTGTHPPTSGNANKILATIKAYSTPSKKMKKEYKEQLTKQAEILK